MIVKTILKKALGLSRFLEWWDKVQMVFAACLILLLFTAPSKDYLDSLVVLAVYGFFLGSFGYMINAYAERKEDIRAGKRLEVHFLSDSKNIILLCFLAAGALGIPLLYKDDRVKILGLVTFFLALFYSVKPIKLKERGLLGILAGALPQRALPFLFYAFLIPSDEVLTAFLFGWLFLIGLVIMMIHQIMDYENDEKINMDTWARRIGFSRAKKISALFFALLLVYMCLPSFLFGLSPGLAITTILFAFSRPPILFTLEGLRTTRKTD